MTVVVVVVPAPVENAVAASHPVHCRQQPHVHVERKHRNVAADQPPAGSMVLALAAVNVNAHGRQLNQQRVAAKPEWNRIQ